MAAAIPYTYYQCPCSSETRKTARSLDNTSPTEDGPEADEDERDFDPKAPRANYSLYPLEHLLYCEGCQQIRCERCVNDEIVTLFCPQCLFETPSSFFQKEGYACSRGCCQCPICTAPLQVSTLEPSPSHDLLGAEVASKHSDGPWVYACQHCNWSTKEIGIKFTKPYQTLDQLNRLKNGGIAVTPCKERRANHDPIGKMIPSKISGESDADAEAEARPPVDDLDPETRFDNLRMFYQGQIAAATPSNGPLSFGADFNYASPNALSRIMGIYTSAYTTKKKVAKPVPMREATSLSEGLVPLSSTSESSIIDRLRSVGISGTTTTPQRLAQLNHTTRFTSDLRPIPFTLRTKRAKRCRCRHIVSKPESKLNTTRYRIRLLASSFIPNLALKPFPANPSTPSPLMSPTTPLSATLPSASSAAGGLTQAQTYLVPGKTHHFVLSVKNPLFEHVKVNLATPGHTPGRFRHRVTILCPQFEIGATRDVWDDALGEGGANPRDSRQSGSGGSKESGVPEAGKVWERGRNSVGVVVEVVPAVLDVTNVQGGDGDAELREDDDILEIPVFVRVEWEAEEVDEGPGRGKAEKGAKKNERVRRELAYWCVLGVGRVGRVGGL